MTLALQGTELAGVIIALLAGGVVTGILAGLFGVGGGGILVIVLYEVFRITGVDADERMHLSVGTSLAIIVPTSLRSLYSHHKRGAVDWDILRRMGPAVLVGVIAGVLIASSSSGEVLKAVFVVSAILMAGKLFLGADRWTLGTALPGNPFDAIFGIIVGVISTLIGIGGGVYISTYMTLFGRSIHQAVATSSGFGPIIALPAAIGFILAGWGRTDLPPGAFGYVSLLAMAIVAPASLAAAPLGVRLAHNISRRSLEIAFATFMTAIAARFAYIIYAN